MIFFIFFSDIERYGERVRTQTHRALGEIVEEESLVALNTYRVAGTTTRRFCVTHAVACQRYPRLL